MSREPMIIGQKLTHARKVWTVISREEADDLIYPYVYEIQEMLG